ncbi:MAG: glutaredoxin [Opitutaceae bacterium]
MNASPILYIKRGCPYCRQAAAFFSTHGVEVEIRDVSKNHAHLQRLIEASDQGNVPTFVYGDFVVADFSVDELLDELAERPDIRLSLGLGDNDDEA